MNNTKLNQACAEYFKTTPGFNRLFKQIKEKYRSLGYLGGTIKLENLTQMEKEALSGLLKKDYYSKKSTTISIDKITSSLENTKFQGADFEQALMEYFKEDLISKKKERSIYNNTREEYFNSILQNYINTRAGEWLSFVLESRGNPYKTLMQKYDTDKEGLKTSLNLLLKAINFLTFSEKNPIRLALFSSMTSRNPHSFDINSELGKLLLYPIAYFLKTKHPSNAEEKAELLYEAGIINDEISNYTMASFLLAYWNGRIHPGWQGFYDSGEPMQISLWNLSMVDKIISPRRRVYIFENQTVFSEVLSSTGDIRPSLMCTYGQIKLASLILLDKLLENLDNIYYSGDFDPEGLQIADKLKERYGEKLILWRYTIEDYNMIKSAKKLELPRLRKLSSIKDITLKQLQPT